MKRISIILPTFNEKENVLALIKAIHEHLNIYDHEIIIVDDNSPDGTYEAVMREEDARLKCLLRKKEKSLARSIRCGIEASDGDLLVVMDSDFNHQPRYLKPMIEALEHYDCVVASRFLPGGKMDNPLRHALSWIFNRYILWITRGEVSDNLYGFFAVRREVMQRCDYGKIFFGYGDYFIRLMYYFQRNEISIYQVPAVNGARRQGQGNRQFLKTAWQYFLAVHALVFKERLRLNVYGN